MKTTILLSALLVAIFFGDSLHAADRPHAGSPNILLVLADDMGMGDTSAYQDFTGNQDDVQVHTSSMERLARQGIRFIDAHAPASRCTTTRYGLLTGRYSWRNRLKCFVLFGAQGDPMIEADRPTIATMLGDEGYRTAMVGKWHVGLRYRRSDGSPAAAWEDADLSQPLHTTPLDHGFDFARFTSRSHGTSGPDAGGNKGRQRNTPDQDVGPGHLHGRTAVSASGSGKQLIEEGRDAYVLSRLGSRHSDHAIEFLTDHVKDEASNHKPFFLYYAANSNHTPYTPDDAIGGEPVAGAARTKKGEPMDARHDFIYENDVALGRLLEWLATTDDPRNSGSKLVANTLVIFTSDNGAERDSDVASGPFRSHKGSCYEGGHRVPFIAAWSSGGVGDGDTATPGLTNETPIGLQDLYATFAEIVGADLPNLREGEKGAEDSFSVLSAFHGESLADRPPLFFNDHKQAKDDPAVLATRFDSPTVDGKVYEGAWKVFFDARLVREGVAKPYELYNLSADPRETTNLIDRAELRPLVDFLTRQALLHRNAGGHRLAAFAPSEWITFDWQADPNQQSPLIAWFAGESAGGLAITTDDGELTMTISGVQGDQVLSDAKFSPNFRGLGLDSGDFQQVEGGEGFLIEFDRDVLIDSAAIVAGNGQCGGFYQIGSKAPLAIYCVDADNDFKEQQGVLSDLGILRKGEHLRLDSHPHFDVESPGQWRLGSLTVRVLDSDPSGTTK